MFQTARLAGYRGVVSIFGHRMASDEGRGNGQHLRETAEKVRQLAREAQLSEVREELFNLADRIDRMAEELKTAGG
jgi:hypothetical protein